MKNGYDKTEKLRFLQISAIEKNSILPHRFSDDFGPLARSIARYGILQPLLVRKSGRGYELLAGRRRLGAAKLLGLNTVPCRVLHLTPREAAELIFAENLHRVALNPFEEAAAATRLQKTFPYRLGELAERIGESPSLLASKERLMHFSAQERSLLMELGLSPSYGECLLHLRDSALRQLAIRHIAARNLSVAEAGNLCLSLALHPEEFIPSLVPERALKKRPVRRFVVKDVRFFINSVDRTIGSIRQAGIDVEADKTEDEGHITYRIKIPK